jgi:hypothetical protein
MLLITFLYVFFNITPIQEQETTLFNRAGKPVAYIAAQEENTIYLWDGTPVAYLQEFRETFAVYGFNGKHIAWYENGLLRDLNGKISGSDKTNFRGFTHYEPYKRFKKFKPFKRYQRIIASTPFIHNTWGDTDLLSLLFSGLDESISQ